eukprot:6269905-Pyramimonas_sp.AAC.1
MGSVNLLTGALLLNYRNGAAALLATAKGRSAFAVVYKLQVIGGMVDPLFTASHDNPFPPSINNRCGLVKWGSWSLTSLVLLLLPSTSSYYA